MRDSAFKRRAFLNTEEWGGTACVDAHVGECDEKGNVDASIKLTDCNRQIELDFDVYSRDALTNARSKAQRLRTVVNSFVREYLAQLDIAEGRME